MPDAPLRRTLRADCECDRTLSVQRALEKSTPRHETTAHKVTHCKAQTEQRVIFSRSLIRHKLIKTGAFERTHYAHRRTARGGRGRRRTAPRTPARQRRQATARDAATSSLLAPPRGLPTGTAAARPDLRLPARAGQRGTRDVRHWPPSKQHARPAGRAYRTAPDRTRYHMVRYLSAGLLCTLTRLWVSVIHPYKVHRISICRVAGPNEGSATRGPCHGPCATANAVADVMLDSSSRGTARAQRPARALQDYCGRSHRISPVEVL